MTIKPESIFIVRGYDVNGNQKGATGECKSIFDAVMTASTMLGNDCKAIDIDVLEQTGLTCQNG